MKRDKTLRRALQREAGDLSDIVPWSYKNSTGQEYKSKLVKLPWRCLLFGHNFIELPDSPHALEWVDKWQVFDYAAYQCVRCDEIDVMYTEGEY